ncbi:hypothetical protein T492DRAFT_981782 [Pavlovales sp. CCMP2436]|nr:hypothetical protein T492DRAFT_981782 [Pavlovales sp. CCMP2436]
MTSAQPMRAVDCAGQSTPRFATPRAMLEAMEAATCGLAADACVRNFVGVIDSMELDHLVCETELFPADALDFYTHLNLGGAVPTPPDVLARMDVLRGKYYAFTRGGSQGDYRAGMAAKVDDVVDCLRSHPGSKRALLCVPYSSGRQSHEVQHSDTDEAKCLREIHFFIDASDGRVHATGFMRAQAAVIFPKNIHMIGCLLGGIAARLQRQPGTYTHFVTTLVNGRE